ncbi:hypothetical protein Acr_02g0009870 [Actinidia rufa]|uniref:Uncharacterized protein n=1 Tax=Actinidia rufa TaxID=165716 RepID=A0A7J0EAR5_9ERIC|nr:hypothetical protein Acr_02g0009870 [Actinidia rufa]
MDDEANSSPDDIDRPPTKPTPVQATSTGFDWPHQTLDLHLLTVDWLPHHSPVDAWPPTGVPVARQTSYKLCCPSPGLRQPSPALAGPRSHLSDLRRPSSSLAPVALTSRIAIVADTSPGLVPNLSHIQSQFGLLQFQLGYLFQQQPSYSTATLATGTPTAFQAKTSHPIWVLNSGTNDHMSVAPIKCSSIPYDGKKASSFAGIGDSSLGILRSPLVVDDGGIDSYGWRWRWRWA